MESFSCSGQTSSFIFIFIFFQSSFLNNFTPNKKFFDEANQLKEDYHKNLKGWETKMISEGKEKLLRKSFSDTLKKSLTKKDKQLKRAREIKANIRLKKLKAATKIALKNTSANIRLYEKNKLSEEIKKLQLKLNKIIPKFSEPKSKAKAKTSAKPKAQVDETKEVSQS